MRFNTKTVLSATTMAGSTVVYSDPIDLENVYCMALQLIPAGTTAAGSIQLQASNQNGRSEQGGEITAWANVGTPLTLSDLASQMIEEDAVGFKWLRIQYTPNAGNGNLTAILATKGS